MEKQDGSAWAPGGTVGHYTLLAKLATGGMAEIWLARQSGLRGFERIVVVKRIIESLSADESFVEMFLDEARIIVQLTHPNIVQVFDLGEHAGAYYIAMEYLAGENLATVARAAAKAGQQLEPESAVKLVVSALEGLAHAHTRTGVDGKPLNVVHRDISPQNIVLTWEGQVKLVDFGIARAANRATQTQGQQLKGKFAYMAPEQAEGHELDGRADVFAMGIVLWELVTHKRLYTQDDSIQILKTLIGPAPVMSAIERNPKVPPELSEILDRALEKNPAQRYPDAASFKTDLENWLRTRGGGPSTAQLAEMMHTLFAARIKERKELIENAASGQASPTNVTEGLKPTTNRTMPGQTGLVERNGRLVAALGAMVVLLAFVGVLTWKAFTAPTVNEPPVVPTEVEFNDNAPVPSSIVVETEPPGAVVSLDGKAVGKSPLTLSEGKPGEHVVSAELEGRQSVKRTITVKGEGEQLMMVLSLPELKVAVAPVDAGTEKTGDKGTVVAKDNTPKSGRLSLNTDPWTRVTENGKSLGDTPLIELSLPVGRHRLQLVNEKEKIDLAIEVEVKPGQLTKKVLRL
ncbi:MAG: serine/threonine-protein kinase [Myxococcaceae bacterium]